MTPLDQWLSRLIMDGTGIPLPARATEDPTQDCEARQTTWNAARPIIEGLKQRQERDDESRLLILRFGALRLADISLCDYRQPRPLRTTPAARHQSPRQAFLVVHRDPDQQSREGAQRTKGRPAYTEVLSILSALHWHLEVETNRPHLEDLADVVLAVYPPIFLLRGSDPERRQPGRQQRSGEYVEAWRRLSDSLSKYRNGATGEADYLRLLNEMTLSSPPQQRPPSRNRRS